MIRVRRKLVVLCGVICMTSALLTACSTIRQGSVKPENPLTSEIPATVAALPAVDVPVACQMDDMMQYYESLRKQPAADLGRVYDKVKQNFAQNKSDENRARLVLFLILPNSSVRDLNSAVNLVNEWPRDTKSPTSLQSFRNLLASLLVEQQRLNHGMEELSQKLKDEQKRVETLQSQIEAIKSMEKNLILREP
jgi:hypothetical protein